MASAASRVGSVGVDGAQLVRRTRDRSDDRHVQPGRDEGALTIGRLHQPRSSRLQLVELHRQVLLQPLVARRQLNCLGDGRRRLFVRQRTRPVVDDSQHCPVIGDG